MGEEVSTLKVVIEAEDRTEGGFDSAAKRAKGFSDEVERGGNAVSTFSKNLDKITKPVQMVGTAAMAAGVAVAKASMDYETAFTGVRKTVNGTEKDFQKIDAGIKMLSKTIPLGSKELANLAAVGGQLGVGANDIVKFTETIAAMGVATNLAGEDGAAALAKFINVSGESINNVDRVGSSIVALGNNTSTTEADIAYMAVRMAKFGKTVGMNSNQILGYSAALSSMGVEAQAGGSAIGRVWTDIESNVANNSKTLQSYAKYAGISANEFKEKWSTDPSGAFNGLIKGLSAAENLTLALSEIGVTGTLDQSAVMALANNYTLLEKCMSLSSEAYSENTALSKEASAAYGTTASKLKIASNSIVNAGMKWGDVLLPEIKKGADTVSDLADRFGDLDEGTKDFIITGGKAAISLGVFSKGATVLSDGIGRIITSGKLAAAALGPVGIGIAATTAAVAGGVYVYNKYHEAQMNWGKGLSDYTANLSSNIDKVKELSKIQNEIQELKVVISSDDSSEEDVEAAKERLEQIASYLNENYSLNITVNADGLEETANQVEGIVKDLKKSSLPEMRREATKTAYELSGKKDEYNWGIEQINQKSNKVNMLENDLERTAQASLEVNDLIDDFNTKLMDYNSANGTFMDSAEPEKYISMLKEYGKQYNDILSKYGFESDFNPEEPNANFMEASSSWLAGADKNIKWYEGKIKSLNDDIDALKKSGKDYENLLDTYTDYGATEYAFGDRTKGIEAMQRAVENFGASASDTATKAAYMNNNIENIGDLKGKPEAEIQKVQNEATNLLKSFEGMEDKSIRLNVETGNVEIIDDLSGKISEISNESVTVSVDANGDISILDNATGLVQTLSGLGAVALQVNADGNIELLDDANKKIAEINKNTGKITVNAEYPGAEKIEKAIEDQQNIQGDKSVKTTVEGSYPGKAEIKEALSDATKLKSKHVYYTVHYSYSGKRPTGNAKGTRYFKGGLAMVNDQKGVTDPRELIIDRGRAFIPEGKDVILPLSKGAKIYTASQTKDIMRMLGIPTFAAGKDNDMEILTGGNNPFKTNLKGAADGISEAFKAAKEAWDHIVKTRTVSATEQLAKWVEFSEQFKDNAEDIKVIEEQIYSMRRAARSELNELSEEYIDERIALGDWDAFADNAIAAFDRVKEREMKDVEEGNISEKEAKDYLQDLGEGMLDNRIALSKAWLEHEVKYNNMAVEDYIAGINRMLDYTNEFFAAGMSGTVKYYEVVNELTDLKVDKMVEGQKAEVEAWKKDRDAWEEERSFYNDWADFGDSETSFLKRSIAQIEELKNAGKMEWEEYWEEIKKERRKLYSAQGEEFDNMLKEYDDYINSVSDSYDKMIEKKEDAFSKNKTLEDLAKAEKQSLIYSGAVTERGKEVYEEAIGKIKDLNHELEIMKLTEKQTRVVEELKADYEKLESQKNFILKSSMQTGLDISAISQNISFAQENVAATVDKILKAVENLSIGTSYGDTNINLTSDNDFSSIINHLTRVTANGFN